MYCAHHPVTRRGFDTRRWVRAESDDVKRLLAGGAPTFACGAGRGVPIKKARIRKSAAHARVRALEDSDDVARCSEHVVGMRRRRRMEVNLGAHPGARAAPVAAKDGKHPRLVFFGSERQSQAESAPVPLRQNCDSGCHWLHALCPTRQVFPLD